MLLLVLLTVVEQAILSHAFSTPLLQTVAAPGASIGENKTWTPGAWQHALSGLPWETKSPRSLRLTGEFPRDLNGILYKTGPAKFQRGGQHYAHWLEGDGAVVRLEIHTDANTTQVTLTSRFVQTESFAADEVAGYTTTRGTFGTPKAKGWNALDLKLKNPANTNALRIGDKVLALSEVGLPYRMDPTTLETLGVETFADHLREPYVVGNSAATLGNEWIDKALGFGNAMVAHVRTLGSMENQREKRVVMAGIQQDALTDDTLIDLWELEPRTGDAVSLQRGLRLEDTGFPAHDFICTSTRAIWLTCPAEGNLIPFLIGQKGPAECLGFRPGATSTLHLVDRQAASGAGNDELESASAPVRKVSTPGPIHPVHFGCAWDTEDTGAVIYLSGWDTQTMEKTMARKESLLGSWAPIQEGDFSGIQAQSLLKIVLQENSDVTVKSVASDAIEHIDFVKCHPNLEGLKCSYLYGTLASPSQQGKPAGVDPPQAICIVDLEEEKVVDIWFAGYNKILDDFILIPKKDTSDEETHNEQNAWILAPYFDGDSKTTSFAVLDASDLSKGSVAEAHLDDHHIPWALHGSWWET